MAIIETQADYDRADKADYSPMDLTFSLRQGLQEKCKLKCLDSYGHRQLYRSVTQQGRYYSLRPMLLRRAHAENEQILNAAKSIVHLFAEDCVKHKSISKFGELNDLTPDGNDMEVWGLSEGEWLEAMELAIEHGMHNYALANVTIDVTIATSSMAETGAENYVRYADHVFEAIVSAYPHAEVSVLYDEVISSCDVDYDPGKAIETDIDRILTNVYSDRKWFDEADELEDEDDD